MALQWFVRPVAAAVGHPLTDEQVCAITACAAAYLRGQQPSKFAVEWFGWVAAGAGEERRFAVPRSHRADAVIVHMLDSIRGRIVPIDFHDEGEWWEWRVTAAGVVAHTDREGVTLAGSGRRGVLGGQPINAPASSQTPNPNTVQRG